MSQSILKEGYAESLRNAASKAAINKVVSDLVAARKALGSNQNRLGKNNNIYQLAIDALDTVGTTISKLALQQRVSRALKEEKNSQLTVPGQVRMTSSMTEVSSLTSPDIENSPSTETFPIVDDIASEEVTNNSHRVGTSAGGQPRGTTKTQKKQENENDLKCIEVIVLEYSGQVSAAKSVEERVEYGCLNKIIEDKKIEFNVEHNISKKTIHTRVYRGSASTPHRGTKSPLEGVEPAFLQICIQMGKL